MSNIRRVVICGAGAWGTAIALHLARQGCQVALLPRRGEQSRAICASRENGSYLPGFTLPDEIQVAELEQTSLDDVSAVFLASPSYALKDWLERIRAVGLGGGSRLFISLAKGLELNTLETPCQMIAEALPGSLVASLSGPTFAGEVAEGKPAAMTLGCESDDPIVGEIQLALSGPSMRIYLSHDLQGVELGGCLKNVYAIAAGCCQGLALGDNALAALLTRALAEMVRVGVALGARMETFYGLSGFGDLVATCHGEWSRNRTFGEAIARGKSAREIISSQRTAVEGYRTSRSFHEMLSQKGIEAPILDQVYRVLYEDKPPIAALDDLMCRELKREID